MKFRTVCACHGCELKYDVQDCVCMSWLCAEVQGVSHSKHAVFCSNIKGCPTHPCIVYLCQYELRPCLRTYTSMCRVFVSL